MRGIYPSKNVFRYFCAQTARSTDGKRGSMTTISGLIRLLESAIETCGDVAVYILDGNTDYPFDVAALEDEVQDAPMRGYPDMTRPCRIVLHSVESARAPRKES